VRCAALWQTCCTQRWTLTVINLWQNKVNSACDSRRFRVIASYLSKVANFNLSHPHLVPPLGWPHLSFAEIFSIAKLVPALSCGIVCVMLRLPISVEHWLVTDWQTNTLALAYTALAWRRAVKIKQRVNTTYFNLIHVHTVHRLLFHVFHETAMKQQQHTLVHVTIRYTGLEQMENKHNQLTKIHLENRRQNGVSECTCGSAFQFQFCFCHKKFNSFHHIRHKTMKFNSHSHILVDYGRPM